MSATSARLIDSALRIDTNLAGLPQLGGTAATGGSLLAVAARELLLAAACVDIVCPPSEFSTSARHNAARDSGDLPRLPRLEQGQITAGCCPPGAVQVATFGGPSALHLTEVPDPTRPANAALVPIDIETTHNRPPDRTGTG